MRRQYAIWVPGDVAGFDEETAAKLVAGGAAVYDDLPKAEPEKGGDAEAVEAEVIVNKKKEEAKEPEAKEAKAPRNRRAPRPRTK